MNTLYTVNRSPSMNLLESCRRYLKPGDGLLFLEDGSYHAVQQNAVDQIDSKVSVYCLKEDLAARGLTDRLLEPVQAVSYRRFVELCTEFDKVVSWF